MTQRDGRIIRQGNTIAEPEILRYGIEQTLDAGMYAILERKQKFINDAMKGRCARTIQEINDDCALDYASFSAAISGNPKLRRKVIIETRLKELDALERQHRRNIRVRQDQEKSLAALIPAMTEELPELERFTKTYPNLELGSLVMRYGSRELTGTIAEKCDSLNRIIRNAYLAAIKDCNFLNRNGSYIMEDLSIGNLEIRLVAHGTLLYDGKFNESESAVHFQIKGWNLPHLPVKLSGDVSDAEHLLNAIRKLIHDKPGELEKCRMELEAKTARLAKFKSTPEEEFSAAKEKSALSLELEQIIFELNKTSEGQRRHYDSDVEPKLSDYFPELGKTKTFADIEILDGGNDAPEPEKDRECA